MGSKKTWLRAELAQSKGREKVLQRTNAVIQSNTDVTHPSWKASSFAPLRWETLVIVIYCYDCDQVLLIRQCQCCAKLPCRIARWPVARLARQRMLQRATNTYVVNELRRFFFCTDRKIDFVSNKVTNDDSSIKDMTMVT